MSGQLEAGRLRVWMIAFPLAVAGAVAVAAVAAGVVIICREAGPDGEMDEFVPPDDYYEN